LVWQLLKSKNITSKQESQPQDFYYLPAI